MSSVSTNTTEDQTALERIRSDTLATACIALDRQLQAQAYAQSAWSNLQRDLAEIQLRLIFDDAGYRCPPKVVEALGGTMADAPLFEAGMRAGLLRYDSASAEYRDFDSAGRHSVDRIVRAVGQ